MGVSMGGSKPPFSDSGIFLEKIPESENDGFSEGFGTPIDFETPIQAKFV